MALLKVNVYKKPQKTPTFCTQRHGTSSVLCSLLKLKHLRTQTAVAAGRRTLQNRGLAWPGLVWFVFQPAERN